MPVPTPLDIARRTAALHTAHPPLPVRPVPDAPELPRREFNVGLYEHLLRRSGLRRNAVAVGCVLTGYASRTTGALSTHTPSIGVLSRTTELGGSSVRMALRELEIAGWIQRPAVVEGDTSTRAITLTVPDAVPFRR